MNKPSLFDEVTRELAGSVSRRRAMKLVGRALAAGALFFLWPKHASASMICLPANDDQCFRGPVCTNRGLCCPNQYKCCTKGTLCNCCAPSETCQANGTCA